MPVIYLPKELYDALVKADQEPAEFVISAAQEKLEILRLAVQGPKPEEENVKP